MNSDEAHAMFVSKGEIKSALGATIILPRWDTEVEDHAWLDYAAADTAIPTFRHGRLTKVTLWSEFLDGIVYWRHLEHHAVGHIEHTLFPGTATNLGPCRPFEDHLSTKSYSTLVDAESRIPTLVDHLTAGYPPNAPTLSWRRPTVIADAGRSNFSQCLPLYDALDEHSRGRRASSARFRAASLT